MRRDRHNTSDQNRDDYNFGNGQCYGHSGQSVWKHKPSLRLFMICNIRISSFYKLCTYINNKVTTR